MGPTHTNCIPNMLNFIQCHIYTHFLPEIQRQRDDDEECTGFIVGFIECAVVFTSKFILDKVVPLKEHCQKSFTLSLFQYLRCLIRTFSVIVAIISMLSCHLYLVAVLILCCIMMPLVLQLFPVTHILEFEGFIIIKILKSLCMRAHVSTLAIISIYSTSAFGGHHGGRWR